MYDNWGTCWLESLPQTIPILLHSAAVHCFDSSSQTIHILVSTIVMRCFESSSQTIHVLVRTIVMRWFEASPRSSSQRVSVLSSLTAHFFFVSNFFKLLYSCSNSKVPHLIFCHGFNSYIAPVFVHSIHPFPRYIKPRVDQSVIPRVFIRSMHHTHIQVKPGILVYFF